MFQIFIQFVPVAQWIEREVADLKVGCSNHPRDVLKILGRGTDLSAEISTEGGVDVHLR